MVSAHGHHRFGCRNLVRDAPGGHAAMVWGTDFENSAAVGFVSQSHHSAHGENAWGAVGKQSVADGIAPVDTQFHDPRSLRGAACTGRGSRLVHPSVQEAIRNGEQSGQMGAPLIHMADFLDEENELLIKALSRLLEPVILVFLGIMVGLMALSMFLPLFDLVSSASGGGK